MDLYRINLNLLVALDALLLEQSVSLAAKKLFITQAAMSNNLQQLRQLFKDELLVREKNRMRLTPYAKELQPKLHQVLQEVYSLVASGQRFAPEISARVFKIGMPDYLAALLLPKLLAHLETLAPNISLAISPVAACDRLEYFERGDIDLALGKMHKPYDSIATELLFSDKIICVLSNKHPLAKKEELSFQDYVNARHIAIRANAQVNTPITDEALEKLGYQRDVAVALPFVSPIFKLIEQSDTLIGTMTERMALAYQQQAHYVIKPLPFKAPKIGFYLAWHPRHNSDLGHQWLRQQIQLLFQN